MKECKPWYIFHVALNVVAVIAIPVSMLAGLYTANRVSMQMLLGKRPDIVNEVMLADKLCVFALME